MPVLPVRTGALRVLTLGVCSCAAVGIPWAILGVVPCEVRMHLAVAFPVSVRMASSVLLLLPRRSPVYMGLCVVSQQEQQR